MAVPAVVAAAVGLTRRDPVVSVSIGVIVAVAVAVGVADGVGVGGEVGSGVLVGWGVKVAVATVIRVLAGAPASACSEIGIGLTMTISNPDSCQAK